MAIEAVELLKYAGIDPEKFDKIEDAKEAFDTNFIKKDGIKDFLIKQPEYADPIIGKRMSIVERKTFSLLEEAGIDTEQFKGKKVEEIFDAALPTFKETIANYKKSATSGNDEKIKELSESLEKYKSKVKDTESLLNTTKTEFEKFQENIKVEKKTNAINDYFGKAFSSIDFSPEADELKKEGFKSVISKKYGLDLDEEGKPYVFSAETKERIKDPEKHGSFMDFDKILKLEAEKLGVIKKNPYSGKPAGFTPQNNYKPTAPAENARKLNGR
jgi:hypothetical protein